MAVKSDYETAAAQNKPSILKLPNVDKQLISYILDEIIENKPQVKFDDIGKSICCSLNSAIHCYKIVFFLYDARYHGSI